MTGKRHSEETKEKIGLKKRSQHIVPKSAFKKGFIPWNKGKKYPAVSIRNKIMNRLRTGYRHWNWKGGVSKITKSIRQMPEYREWRTNVFKRDSWTCQTCRSRGYVIVHHINEFSNIIRDNKIKNLDDSRKCHDLWDIDNGVTLCVPCHRDTHRAR